MDEDELKTKIYVRMIKSYMALKDPRKAVEIGDRGIADVRDGAPIQKELVKARQLIAEEENKRRELYRKMMRGSFHPSDAGAAQPDTTTAPGTV